MNTPYLFFGGSIPKDGSASVTLKEQVYKMAKEITNRDGIKIAKLVERAIQIYADTHYGLEEKGRIKVKLLEQLEKQRLEQAS